MIGFFEGGGVYLEDELVQGNDEELIGDSDVSEVLQNVDEISVGTDPSRAAWVVESDHV